MQQEPKRQGILLVDKPRGMTSHDVVDRIRRAARERRVGHAGTLDPMAEGLLILAIGPATRILQYLVGLPKEYSGTITLGAISSTYDAEGEIVAQPCTLPKDPRRIIQAMRAQTGLRTQLPPPYSAVKVGGKKLYEYARRGEEVPQKPREVRIYQFEMEEYSEPEIRFSSRVGSGTYIRSMAHDLGIQLECGAYLSGLKRESVGQFHISQATPLALIMENPALIGARILGIAEALGHMPKLTVGGQAEAGLMHGRGFTTRDILECEGLPRADEDTLALNERGEALSIVRGQTMAEAEGEPDRLFFRPVRVLAKPQVEDSEDD